MKINFRILQPYLHNNHICTTSPRVNTNKIIEAWENADIYFG